MEIKEASIEDKKRWNNFVLESPYGSFLQSWEWGDFQESLGNKVFRLQIIDKGQILGTMLLVKHRLPRNFSWLYSPRGPVWGLGNWDLKIGQSLRQYLATIARNEKAIFLKIEPKIEKRISHQNLKIPEKFIQSTSVQPENTLILDLEKSSAEILAQMHPKTRYNLKLSERKGVTCRISDNSPYDINAFYEILKETASKNKIKIFPFKHYQKLIKILSKENLVELFIAEYKKKPIAAVIASFFGSEASYLHGASLYNFRRLMAPHQLQWKVILEAKNRSCKKYDLWGIAPENQPNHKWAGITRFKKGFGGQVVQYLGGLDFVYLPFWYKIYKAGTFLRRI